jgi:hypothetical protein
LEGPERPENHPVDDFQRRPGGSPGQRAVSPFPHPQSAQVRFMRTLLVSDDLTADFFPPLAEIGSSSPSEKAIKGTGKNYSTCFPSFWKNFLMGWGHISPQRFALNQKTGPKARDCREKRKSAAGKMPGAWLRA